jgi:CrcB protein
MNKILLIALAGACGSLSRYWLSGLVYEFFDQDLP